ncbi:hypothetical protein C7375_1275, partial [Frischella perrara]
MKSLIKIYLLPFMLWMITVDYVYAEVR